MAVTGNLQDISLTNLIQMNAQSDFSGRLFLQSVDGEAGLYFANGEIVHAVLGKLTGREAFNQILGWEEGDFNLETDFAAPERTIKANWSDLLLGALKYQDENSTGELKEMVQESPPDLGALFGLEKENINHSPGEGATTSEDNMAKKMQEILTDLGEEAPGLFAAAVIGMDGLPLADFSRQSVDTDSFSAQMTLLIKLVDTTTKKVEAGKVEDYLLTTDKAYLLVRFLDDGNFYLGIGAVRKTSSLGKLRLYSRIYAERLNAALPR